MDIKYLTVEQVAQRLQVHPETVRRWLREGRMRGHRLGPRAPYRIPATEVERFLASQNGDEEKAAA